MDRVPSIIRHHSFASLQAGRALAALLVVFYHNALYIFALDKYWGYDPSHHLFDFSHSGVEFFFVLSGFIILYIHWGDFDQPSRLSAFVRKRFIRIYPIYWLVLAATIPVYFLIPSFGHSYHRDPLNILSSLVLVYANKNLWSEIAVAWTLYHEVLFYFFFALIIFSRTFGLGLFALWLTGSVVALFTHWPPYVSEYLFSPLHLLFGMGMLACWMVKRETPIARPALLAAAGVLLFFLTGLAEDYVKSIREGSFDLLYGMGSTLAILGFLELERQGRLHVPKWLQLMGDASYSIYLTHFMALSMVAKVFMHLNAPRLLPDLLSFLLLPFLVVLLGIAFHVVIERPLLRKLQRSRTPATAAPFVTPSPIVSPSNVTV